MLSGRPGLPFPRLVRIETRKVVDTRSGRWLLGLIAVLTATVLGVTLRFADPGDLSFPLLITMTSTPLMLFYPLLGILTMTSELSQRTALVTFTAEPRRSRVVAAKLTATFWWACIGLVAAILLGAGAHSLAVLARGTPGDFTPDWGALGGFALTLALAIAQGAAFGLLLTSPAAAVTAYLVLPTAWAFAANLVPGLRRVAPWLDPSLSADLLISSSLDVIGWAQLAVSNGLWVALPLTAGVVVLSRRELS